MHKVAEMLYPIKDIAFEEFTCEGIPITIFIKNVNTGFMVPYNPVSLNPEVTLEWYERMFELNGMEV